MAICEGECGEPRRGAFGGVGRMFFADKLDASLLGLRRARERSLQRFVAGELGVILEHELMRRISSRRIALVDRGLHVVESFFEIVLRLLATIDAGERFFDGIEFTFVPESLRQILGIGTERERVVGGFGPAGNFVRLVDCLFRLVSESAGDLRQSAARSAWASSIWARFSIAGSSSCAVFQCRFKVMVIDFAPDADHRQLDSGFAPLGVSSELGEKRFGRT